MEKFKICLMSARALGSSRRSRKVNAHLALNKLIELGYTLRDIYLDSEDEREIRGKNEMEREEILFDREEKAKAATYKFQKLQEDILKKSKDIQKKPMKRLREDTSSAERVDESDESEQPKKKRLQKGDTKQPRMIAYDSDSDREHHGFRAHH